MKRRRTLVLTIATLALLAGCGSDTKASEASVVSSASSDAQASAGASATAVQLGGDPCALLTVPEMEAVLGSGVEQGGFGADVAGRCTYSRFGDVGSGVVQITLQDPQTCDVVMQALASGSLQGTNASRIDVGDGGFYVQDSYAVFIIHGGCVAIGGSKSGINLGHDTLVSLAAAAAARLG